MFYRFGLFLARWRWPVLLAWAVALLAALPLAPRITSVLAAGGFSAPSLESHRASALLDQRFGYDPATLVVVFTSARLRNDDPRFQAAIDRALERVRALEEVAWVATPRENPRQASADGTTAYALVALHAAPEQYRSFLPRLQAALQPTELEQVVTGAPIFYDDIQAVTERDLRRAEMVSLPFAALALVLVFGSLVAAALPGAVGGASVLLTLGLMVLLSRVVDLSIFSLNLVTMLGLGLGIDYSLFLASRFREELGAGHAVPEAIGRAMATAGRAVLFSGATVFVGLLALIGFEFMALRSLGLAGALVVLVSVLAALTLLPALLAVVGRGVDRLVVVRPSPRRRAAWARLAAWVMAHPLRVLGPVLVGLLLLGLPFLHVQFGAPDASILPQDVPSRRGFDLLRQKFGEGELSPILVVLEGEGPMLGPQRVGQVYDFVQAIARDSQVERVDSLASLDPRLTRAQYQLLYARPDRLPDLYAEAAVRQFVRDGTVLVRVTSRASQTSAASKALVGRLRAMEPPPGLRLLVGGGTAGVVDYSTGLYQDFPRALAFIVASTYVLLLVLFRSLLLPLKAIFMNVLSITASYGALVVVFQDGLLAGLLGFAPLGFVEASLPIVLFCVLFGLSMDYEVFLLSRVKEAYDAHGDNRRGVAEGLQRSGGIITSAAAIIVLVSGSFVAADIVLIKALGLGTAIAVFLDATIVRALLVPATMRLLGDWNWWAPFLVRRALPKAEA
ncbi:MAG: MMPL family transporter [Chloroflexi bacterium]|nr:MMPL family transporter [Chloroflexota bacterium]